MQYQDRRRASLARAMMRVSMGVTGVLCLVAFFGDVGVSERMKWVMVGLFVGVVVFAAIGGMSDVCVQADETYVDIQSRELLFGRGEGKSCSIDGDRLVKWRYVSVLFMHYLHIDYIGHRGHRRHVSVGMTLVPGRVRREIVSILRKISDNNENKR